MLNLVSNYKLRHIGDCVHLLNVHCIKFINIIAACGGQYVHTKAGRTYINITKP